MGVMACYRAGCSNILCDRYSSEYGYICNDCFNELVESGPDTNIDTFLNTRKEEMITLKKEDPFRKFDSIFLLYR